jgi:RNAse (barnase) inhibitor barstar
MQSSKVENSEEIYRQLEALGFINIDEMFRTATDLYSTNNAEPAGIRLLQTVENPLSNDTQFDIELKKRANSPNWEIQHVSASSEINTVNGSKTPLKVDRYWFSSDGQLPHQQRMNALLQRMAKIVAKKEYFYQAQQTGFGEFSKIAAKLPALNDQLATELKRLGFPPSPEMLVNASYLDDLVFFNLQNADATLSRPDSQKLDFLFAVVYPDNNMPLRIEYVNAGIYRTSHSRRSLSIELEKDFWLYEAPIPSRTQMISSLSSKINLPKDSEKRAPPIAINSYTKRPGRRFGL